MWEQPVPDQESIIMKPKPGLSRVRNRPFSTTKKEIPSHRRSTVFMSAPTIPTTAEPTHPAHCSTARLT